MALIGLLIECLESKRFCLCSSNNTATENYLLSDEERLIEFLLSRQHRRSSRIARPVHTSSRTVNVQFSIDIFNLIKVDAKAQQLTTNIRRQIVWQNELVSWNPDDYGGIKLTAIPADIVWTPNIELHNSIAQSIESTVHVYMSNNGSTAYVATNIFTSACQIDITRFPFDQQNCSLHFALYSNNDTSVSLDFMGGQNFVSVEYFVPNSEWNLLSTEAQRTVYTNDDGYQFYSLEYFLVIRRRAGFYVYVLIVPSVLLSLMTPMLFWIPPSRPDRTSLGMSLFSSFFVLLLALVQLLPSSATESRLGIYYCFSIAVIAVSTIVSSVIINISNSNYQLHFPKPGKVIGNLLRGRSSKRSSCCKNIATISEFELDSSNECPGTPTEIVLSKEADGKFIALLLDRILFLVSVIVVAIAIGYLFMD